MSKTTDSISSTCQLCCQAIKIYAVGPCDHHICFKCSTKMRVLCDQKYCAVCRTEMPKVIFTQKLHPYQGIISHKFPVDRKYGIAFANSKVQEEFRRLQDQRCSVCPARRLPENSFKDLQDHLRKDHEMFFCELCLKHLQIFTHERKCYNRRNLAMHKRKGDPDDTSYRGHPLCEFCDDRYFDNDELLKHLRRQHYFCHFCETDGASNQYYNDYADLKHHFGAEHYLCEEPECATEEFTHAFRSAIDLKAHRAKVHSRNMTRAQAKQARQIDIEVNLPPRPRDNRGVGGGGAGRGRGRRYDRYDYGGDTSRAVQASVETARKEEQTREKEESSAAARNDQKGKKVIRITDKKTSSSTEGRRGSKRDERGTSSPVPKETRKEDTGAEKAAKTTKASKDDNKENQRKDKKASAPAEAATGAMSTATSAKKPIEKKPIEKKPTEKKSTEKEALHDFPSLATFKPLTDEAVTPNWWEDPDSSTVSSSSASSKDGSKKKKKKNNNSGFTIEEPETKFKLFSGEYKVEDDKKDQKSKPSELSPQPMWNLSSSSASSPTPTSASSVKQPKLSWAENAAPSPPTWTTSVTPKSSSPDSTWVSSVSSSKSKPKPDSTRTNNRSTPALGDSSDFPTLSSIASLLGGTSTTSSSSKKQQKENLSTDKKQSKSEKKPVPSTKKSLPPTTWNKIAEPEKNSLGSEVAAKKKQGGISNGSRAPPGLLVASAPAPTPASSIDVTHRAPPGFGQPAPKLNNPPPGFAVSFPVDAVPPLDYVQPTHYKARNFALLEKIKSYLQYDDSKLMIFKTVSGDFRRSKITPLEYYGHCLDLLGENLSKIFSEMVSLLPDVVKQQELLEAANDHKLRQKQQKKEDKVLKISESRGQTNRKASSKAWGSAAEHSTCTQCGQVMLKADMEKHLNSHQDFPSLSTSVSQQEFPSLSSSVSKKSKPMMAPNSWARIK